MNGLIDYDDEEFIRRTKAFCGFLDELQKLLSPRSPDPQQLRHSERQEEGLLVGPETAGADRPFEESK